MLSLKNVKSPDSNFVNFPKVGAYGGIPSVSVFLPWKAQKGQLQTITFITALTLFFHTKNIVYTFLRTAVIHLIAEDKYPCNFFISFTLHVDKCL